MIQTVYVEQEIWTHPRTDLIRARLGSASFVPIGRYGEVFNRRSQNFRLQKQNPSLILAHKFDSHVLPTPAYGLGAKKHFYFSHMLNCLYDCRYCFLQGMFRSAHYVLFVNYEDIQNAIDQTLLESTQGSEVPAYFFSGYDCDSLALDGLSGFVDAFVPFFSKRPQAVLELRTKSTQVRSLLSHTPRPNIVVAFSLSPEPISKALEHKAPSLERRLSAIRILQEAGWPTGLRFDPMIFDDRFESIYGNFFEQVFRSIDVSLLHSVTLGTFRLPKAYHRTLEKLYPDEPLFAGPLDERDGMVSYEKQLEERMRSFCTEKIESVVDHSIFFPYEV